ncbi:MAG: hypothetical protein JJU45_14225 [Acidimicrobiia bacterium]|nr:hypothetical protein [Acidimicrobiia bacterium]
MASPTWEQLEEVGLYDPSAPTADDRRQLLELLVTRGATMEQLLAADRIGRLPTLASDLLLTDEPRYTLKEVSAEFGGDLARTASAIRASGLPVPDPDEVALGEQDLFLLRRLSPALELFPEDTAMSLLRVISSSLARIADASVTAYLDTVERNIVAEGGTEMDHVEAVDRANSVLGGTVEALGPLLLNHLRQAIDRSRRAREGLAGFDTVRMGLGFVDMVGFTPLSQQVSASRLGSLVEDFEARAFDRVAEHDGRVVKLIGDEVMFVAVEPHDAAVIALDLIEAFSDNTVGATPRGGLVFGEVIVRGGDFYGPLVNLASRLAGEAVPGEVLVTDSIRAPLESNDDVALEPAGRRMLKGFAEPIRVWTLERR